MTGRRLCRRGRQAPQVPGLRRHWVLPRRRRALRPGLPLPHLGGGDCGGGDDAQHPRHHGWGGVWGVGWGVF